MASFVQVLANRSNAELSTGPRTEEGKNASRWNALAHGMTSKRVALPHESEEQYIAFRDSMVANFAPQGEDETILAEGVAAALWRLQRMQRVENAFFAARMAERADADPDLVDGDIALATVFADPVEQNRMRLVSRYAAAAQRAVRQALATLETVQARRRQRELERSMLDMMEERGAQKEQQKLNAPVSAPLSRKEQKRLRREQRRNGFVSQSAPALFPQPSEPASMEPEVAEQASQAPKERVWIAPNIAVLR